MAARHKEKGHLMAGLMAAVAVMIIFSSLALQEWSQVLRRENEAEMIFRAKQIAMAIHRYRVDNANAAPTSLEQLIEPSPKGEYYLRRLWTDPLVRDGNWGLLYIGPGGSIVGANGLPAQGGVGTELGSGLGSLGQSPSSLPRGQQGKPQRGRVAPLNQSNLPVPRGVAGLPLAGVMTLSQDKPFRVYKGQTNYSQWLFTYLDYEKLPGQPGQAAGRPGQQRGQPPGLSGGRAGSRPGQPGQPRRPRRP